MTTKTPLSGETAEAMLSDAKHLFENINQAHKDGLLRLAQSDDKDMRAFSNTSQTHWKAMMAVMERQNALNQINQQNAGIVHGYAVDLESARVEVGRRLACLKDVARD